MKRFRVTSELLNTQSQRLSPRGDAGKKNAAEEVFNEKKVSLIDKRRIPQQGLTLTHVSIFHFNNFKFIKSHEYYKKFMDEI